MTVSESNTQVRPDHTGAFLALVGATTATATAYLGGHLVFSGDEDNEPDGRDHGGKEQDQERGEE